MNNKANQIKAIGIIPARYASVRLSGKPLTDIKGKTLIRRVYEGVKDSKLLDRIIIATDDVRVEQECHSFGAECIITPAEIPSGTDRIAYVYQSLNIDYDIILNIQGDEPLLTGEIIDNLLSEFEQSDADVGTLVKKITNHKDLSDPNIVKVAIKKDRSAIYFSRSPIPFVRDYAMNEWLNHNTFWKHIGIYAYRKDALLKFINLPQSQLESLEKLEQLRLLEAGYKYYCVETDAELIGVDTPEDVERVSDLF
jgi:3-deoxy-manno-octulosonate cytidylyltransferase (CMP-KDO synthetase)